MKRLFFVMGLFFISAQSFAEENSVIENPLECTTSLKESHVEYGSSNVGTEITLASDCKNIGISRSCVLRGVYESVELGRYNIEIDQGILDPETFEVQESFARITVYQNRQPEVPDNIHYPVNDLYQQMNIPLVTQPISALTKIGWIATPGGGTTIYLKVTCHKK